MNYTEFKKLSSEQQNKIQKDFIYYLCELNLPSDEILDKLQIPYSTFRIFKKIFNVNRTKEQEYKLKVEARKNKQAEITKKIKQTKLERYGDENYRNEEKIKQTCLEKYGVENPYASKEIIEKKKQTYLKHYGYDNHMKSPEFKKEYKEKRLLKNNGSWNNNPTQTNITKLEKYGPKQIEIVKKIQQTKLERYGNSSYVNSEKAKETWANKTQEEINNILEKRAKTNLEKYGAPNTWVLSTHSSISKLNYSFAELLDSLNINYDMEFRINNRRYDFKIGDILVELNPTYTHNSSVPSVFFKKDITKEPTDKNYHLEKSKLAQENGFRCIHIWDWDDINKMLNMFIDKKKLYARNCEIREISKKECDEFLNLYHLQNTCNGQSIRYGLCLDNTLIQVMTFGKPRYNKYHEYELLRLCSHKDYKIVGGSERLFKHFLVTINPKSIISYCDNSKFSGDVYKRLGMNNIGLGCPTINWSKDSNRISNNLLNQRGFDQLFKTNYGKGTSNRDLMIKHGWREVYDCGQSVWSWKNE